MNTCIEKLSNGNTIEYKIINGTAYHNSTPQEVINILENARLTKKRIRLFYGDSTTGKCWNEEHDIIGYIGRSTGNIKIPLLINNSRSFGGGALLDHCIIKITVDKVTKYKHNSFNTGNFEIKEATTDLLSKGYNTMVYCNSENVANFKTKDKANRYIKFMTGESNSK